MSWAVWLAVPVVVTIIVALWTWVRSRPARQPSTTRSMQAHSEYLDALVETAHNRPDTSARSGDERA